MEPVPKTAPRVHEARERENAIELPGSLINLLPLILQGTLSLFSLSVLVFAHRKRIHLAAAPYRPSLLLFPDSYALC